MNSRSLTRRLERLETRLWLHHICQFRVEFYDRSSDGTLIRRLHSDDDRTEAQQTIRVVFVSATGEQGPKNVRSNRRSSTRG